MTPGQSTFDGNPTLSPPVTTPYRPGPADFNDLALEDDGDDPPGDPTLPSSALVLTALALCIVYGRMIANLTASITYSGGNPQIDSFTATPTVVAQNTFATTFTIARTPGGASSGDIFVYWPSSALPAGQLTRPKASINGSTPGLIAIDRFSNGGNTGVRIVTVDHTGTATDLPFTFDVM